jgi:2-oxoglutarate ferredoxin oxidoreductase subunit alpha
VATDEHDEDSGLISDEFTNAHKRRKMVEKRARKSQRAVELIAPPELEGPAEADVTLVGWGSSYHSIHDAIEPLAAKGIKANHLPIKWIVPFHTGAVSEIVASARRTITVENNYSGQFARYLRSETGLSTNGHIRKYDGEPFMPHHIVDGVVDLLEREGSYVPWHEVAV